MDNLAPWPIVPFKTKTRQNGLRSSRQSTRLTWHTAAAVTIIALRCGRRATCATGKHRCAGAPARRSQNAPGAAAWLAVSRVSQCLLPSARQGEKA